jgi:hypothetical protein
MPEASPQWQSGFGPAPLFFFQNSKSSSHNRPFVDPQHNDGDRFHSMTPPSPILQPFLHALWICPSKLYSPQTCFRATTQDWSPVAPITSCNRHYSFSSGVANHAFHACSHERSPGLPGPPHNRGIEPEAAKQPQLTSEVGRHLRLQATRPSAPPPPGIPLKSFAP